MVRIPYLVFPSSVLALIGLCIGGLVKTEITSSEGILRDKLEQFDRLRSIANYKDTVDAKLRKAETPGDSGMFFANGTTAIVSAQLVSNLKNIAAARGLEVLRAADLPAKTAGPVNLVSGSLDFSGSSASVFALIQDIEIAKPALFIEKLVMHTNASADATAETILTVSMQVSGAVRSKVTKSLPVKN